MLAPSRNRGATLDEARILLSRSGRVEAVRLSDPVAVMRSYQSAIVDVTAYGRLAENLTNLKNALTSHYQGPQKELLVDYLTQRIDTLQNYRSKLAQNAGNGVLPILDKLMQRYGRAVLNSIGSPLKQLPTYFAAKATKLIDDKHLNDSEVSGLLTRLTGGAYKDITTRGDIDTSGATARGLEGLTGDTLERPQIDELLGLSIDDEAERLRHQKRWATVINRVLGSASQFTAGAEFEDYGLSTKNLTNVQKRLRQLDAIADRYFTSANQRIDRGVVFAWKLAATKQGMEFGLAGEQLDEYAADTVTKLLYQTYSLGNLAERTPLSLSDNYLLKMLGLYSSQQQKIGNLLLRAVSDWSRSEAGTAEHEAALRQLWRVGGWAILFNAVSVATISSLARALLAVLSGDESDDSDKIAEQVVFDSLRNITGTFPSIGSAAVDHLLSTNDTINSGGRDGLVDFPAIETAQQGLDALNQTGALLFAEDEARSDRALDALVRTLPDLVAKTAGVPVNLKRIIVEHLTTNKDD